MKIMMAVYAIGVFCQGESALSLLVNTESTSRFSVNSGRFLARYRGGSAARTFGSCGAKRGGYTQFSCLYSVQPFVGSVRLDVANSPSSRIC